MSGRVEKLGSWGNACPCRAFRELQTCLREWASGYPLGGTNSGKPAVYSTGGVTGRRAGPRYALPSNLFKTAA